MGRMRGNEHRAFGNETQACLAATGRWMEKKASGMEKGTVGGKARRFLFACADILKNLGLLQRAQEE